LRLQYPDAIYRLMAHGNGRQDIVCDDVDRDRLQEHLGRAAVWCSWRVFAFAIMSNHVHVVLKTPQPNLAGGMQVFLSSYANGWSRRHRFSGRVFQGRYRTELVEDETYLWTVTRYVHLNPVRGRLVDHPTAWGWGRVIPAMPAAAAVWSGWLTTSCWRPGAVRSAGAYRQYVTAGLCEPPQSFWNEAYQGWILGSGAFIERVRGWCAANLAASGDGNRD